MTNQQTDNETSHNNNLGDLLQRTRQARQKTLEDAAATTRINVKFLRALEENDFGKLPDEIFTRGFIKLYATYLGLDPVDTFKHYISQENLAPSKPVVKLQEDAVIGSELLDKTSVFIKKPNRTLPVTILLAILVIFYILGVFFKSEEQPSNSQLQPEPEITLSPVEPSPLSDTEPSPNQKKDPISKKIAKQPQQPAKPAVRKPAVKSASQAKQKIEPENIAAAKPSALTVKKPTSSSPLTVEKPTTPPPKTATAQPIEQKIKPASLPVTVTVATGPTPAPAQLEEPTDVDYKYVLEARFEESSQVRIKVDDKPQLRYNSQAGIVRIWKANESIVLDLDNRAGVSLTLNGQPFAISDTADLTAIINIPADLPNSSNP